MIFFLKRKLFRLRSEGEIIPPWYFGLVYVDYMHGKDIWCPIPLNYILRAMKLIEYSWDKFRSRPTWIDKRVERYINEINKERIN